MDKEAAGRDSYHPLIYSLLFYSAQFPRPWEGAAHIQVGHLALGILSEKSFTGTPQMCVSVTHWGFLQNAIYMKRTQPSCEVISCNKYDLAAPSS